MRITETVKHLIILNVILFGAGFFVHALQGLFAMYFYQSPEFFIWQPLTHMFMHGGVMHIFFNMFALFSFGTTLEMIWGSKKFLFFYIACGLGAALLHQGVNFYSINSVYSQVESVVGSKAEFLEYITASNGSYSYPKEWLNYITPEQLSTAVLAYNVPVVGASGAIYGLLVAFAFMFPRAELMMMFIPIPIKAMYFVPGILLIDLYGGITGGFSLFGGGSGIAHFAHIGGAITGAILMYYWKKTQFNENRWY
ncbi:rhomboid family intramembrane serine protease [Myroides sp. LJL119]